VVCLETAPLLDPEVVPRTRYGNPQDIYLDHCETYPFWLGEKGFIVATSFNSTNENLVFDQVVNVNNVLVKFFVHFSWAPSGPVDEVVISRSTFFGWIWICVICYCVGNISFAGDFASGCCFLFCWDFFLVMCCLFHLYCSLTLCVVLY